MNSTRAHELRSEVLSSLKLPSSDATEELVDALRTYLIKENITKDDVRKSKPQSRIEWAREFLLNPQLSGRNRHRHRQFWPTKDRPKEVQVTESKIIELLADFMFLDVDKIPRHLQENSHSTRLAKASYQVAPSKKVHNDQQQDLLDKELAAATEAAAQVMKKLAKQDPTYTEKPSDFVLDTSRETRQLSKVLSKSPEVHYLQSRTPNYTSLATQADIETTARTSSVTPPYTPRSTGLNIRTSNNAKHLQSPPMSDKRVGKRPASPFDLIDGTFEERPVPAASIEDFPSRGSTPGEPDPKRVRTSTISAVATAQHEKTSSGTIALQQPINSSQDAIYAWVQCPDMSQSDGEDPAGEVSAPKITIPGAPFSPRRVSFEAFLPRIPSRNTTDVAVQCQFVEKESQSSDRMVIDIKGWEPSQLFELPSIFLDQLAKSRVAHEKIGTNESRARAAVLGVVEDDMRKSWKFER